MSHKDDDKHQAANTSRTSWLPWALVIGMGFLLAYQYLGNPGTVPNPAAPGFNWLPLLAGLICPLMMLFMMSGHGHGQHNSDAGHPNQNGAQGGCCCGHQHQHKQASSNSPTE